MERHLMSKKIAELEKILQKINGASNEIIIEVFLPTNFFSSKIMNKECFFIDGRKEVL